MYPILNTLAALSYEQAQALADFWLKRLPTSTEPCHEGRYEWAKLGPMEIHAASNDDDGMHTASFTIGNRSVIHRRGGDPSLPPVDIAVNKASGPKYYVPPHLLQPAQPQLEAAAS